jgi:hypothetical protein
MRPVSGWAHMMSSTVAIAPQTGVDRYGKPTYGTAVSYIAHLSRKRRMVRTAAGQEIVSDQSVVLNTNVDVPMTSQVTLSTADVGSTESWAIHPLIVSVLRAFDQNGPHHTTLYL